MAISGINSPPLRQKLTIELLGKRRFYLGLIIGFGLAIVTNLLFAYSREVLRGQTFYSDLIIPTEKEFVVYNLFFAAISVTVGCGLAVWVWFHGLMIGKIPRRRINFISAYSIFWSMALLFLVSKVGSTLTWVLFTLDRYDDHLNLSKEFPLLLFLLPTVFFLNIWMPIRLTYRSGKWLFVSLGAYITLSVILAFSSPINQSRLNESWNKYMAQYNRIVDDEIQKAQAKGLKISAQAIEVIRFNRKERAFEQAKNLKERFKSENPVSIDTVVLELIVIKKSTILAIDAVDWNDESARWPFALPEDVYRQIRISDDSVKNGYLNEILKEYENIFNYDLDNWNVSGYPGFSDRMNNRAFMRRRYENFFLKYLMNKSNDEP